MSNNPLELKDFVQIYNLNDHVEFGDITLLEILLKEFMSFVSHTELDQTVGTQNICLYNTCFIVHFIKP